MGGAASGNLFRKREAWILVRGVPNEGSNIAQSTNDRDRGEGRSRLGEFSRVGAGAGNDRLPNTPAKACEYERASVRGKEGRRMKVRKGKERRYLCCGKAVWGSARALYPIGGTLNPAARAPVIK